MPLSLRVLEQGEHWHKVLAVLHWFRAHPTAACTCASWTSRGRQQVHRAAARPARRAAGPGIAQHRHRCPSAWRPRLQPPLRAARQAAAHTPANSRSAPGDQRPQRPGNAGGATGRTAPGAPAGIRHREQDQCPGVSRAGRGILLFGQGYALDRLGDIPWLHRCPLHYWGDIDTHGFAILDRLRAHFPWPAHC